MTAECRLSGLFSMKILKMNTSTFQTGGVDSLSNFNTDFCDIIGS